MQRTSYWRVTGMAVLLFAAACTADTPQSVNEETPVPPSLAPPADYAGNSYNLTTGSPQTINGAVWQYPVPFGVGTGLINPFLGIQAAGDQEGFNTDGSFEYDQTRSNFTNPLPLNQVPVIKENGTFWREFIFDANEENSAPDALFSIDKLDFWVCTGTEAKTYTLNSHFEGAEAPCIKIYAIEGTTTNAALTINPNYLRALATDAATSGSGQALDYRILIPDNYFIAPAGGSVSSLCPYNPLAADCGYYLIVRAKMGYFGTTAPPNGDPDYVTGSTFEEFSTIKRGFVAVTKTANTSLTRTYAWTIDKTVTPTTINLWDGDNQNAAYSVLVTNTGATDGGWAVSGNIVINNPSGASVSIAGVTDAISGIGNVAVSCPVTFPYVLADKATLTCTYNSALPDGATRTNTANVELTDLGISSATASVNFATATVTDVNKTVNITDLYPQPGGSTTNLGTVTAGVNSPRTFNYNRNYACGADKGTKVNRATIVETNQYDDATVTVNCYNLTVSKTAVPARATTYTWTIDKTVKKQADADAAYAASKTFNMITGDEAVARYRILLDRTVASDVFQVTGVITISNPSSSSGAVVVRNVTDAILAPALSATINSCSGGTPSGTIPNGDAANYVSLAANSSMTCNYTATFASNPGTGTLTNRATALGAIPTNNTKSFTGDQTFTYTGVTPSITGSASVTLTDTYGGSLGSFSDDATVNYDKTFTCSNAGNNDNIASINTTPEQTSTARVTINCTDPVVTKTATTSLTRTWDWTIDKFAGTNPGFVDGTLTLAVGQSYIFNYGVTVAIKGGYPVDSEWKTKGTITVTNPAGQSVKLNSISDAVTGGFTPAVSDCKLNGAGTAVTFPYVLAAGANLQCLWAETAMPNATTRTNTATAVKQHRRWTADATVADIAAATANYTGNASVDFAGATVKKVDNCINVSDSPYGALGVVCESNPPAGGFTAPKTFNYQITIGPYESCGPNSFRNTASFTSAGASTNATPVTGSDIFDVLIDIPCEGCTLTQGYWKTHNGLFGLKNGGRKGPPIHVFDNTAWNDYAYWQFFGGTPAPVPPGVTAVPTPPKAVPTWYTTWVTPPKGNPYYNAAHQFMAAMANGGNGAPTTAINTQLAAAYTFFLTANPATAWTTEQKNQLLAWNGLFGSYNEGDIGPGHCDEDATSAP